ncbi:MAG: TIGR02281 family clan AA aspartic protease [Sphingomonadales bacterium]|nr:TIGR02281 family clan AA aspartic protease [Sphingomonadales bacterium]
MFRLLGISLFAIVAMSALAPVLTSRLNHADHAAVSAPDRIALVAPRKSGGDDDGDAALTMQRDSTGQFHLTGTSHGEAISFLVDTGADVVALTEETADRLGIRPAANDFQPMMKTASGTGYAAPVVIDSLEVAGSEFHNVEAVVAQGLGTNLLGQSLLRRLGKVELQGDSMVIRR